MKPSRQTVAIIALAVLWGATVLWGIGQLRARRQADVLLQNKYSRAFYETMQRTKNVEALLSKGLVSGSPDQMDAILSDLWYNANSAQENLSQLPVSHDVVARTSKFLSQVGDYAYALAKSNKTRKPERQGLEHHAAVVPGVYLPESGDVYGGAGCGCGRLSLDRDPEWH